MRTLIALLLLALCQLAAAAYPCGPGIDSPGYTSLTVGADLHSGEGPLILWGCYPNQMNEATQAPAAASWHCLDDGWTNVDLRRLGDRTDTIRLAADRLAAFEASVKRFRRPGESPRCRAALDRWIKYGIGP